MMTLLVTILLAGFILEAVCAYLLYKRRNQVKYLLQNYLGVQGVMNCIGVLQDDMHRVETTVDKTAKTVRLLRKTQKATLVKVSPTADKLAKVRAFLASGSKIEAVKEYRQVTGSGLKEAIDAVTKMGTDVANEPVVALAKRGELIEAIKLYRNIHGSTLRDAKDAVEVLRDGRPIPTPTNSF